MKTTIIAVLLALGVGYTANAYLVEPVRGNHYGFIGSTRDSVDVYKIEDGNTDCYITRHKNSSTSAISCVLTATSTVK